MFPGIAGVEDTNPHGVLRTSDLGASGRADLHAGTVDYNSDDQRVIATIVGGVVPGSAAFGPLIGLHFRPMSPTVAKEGKK